MGMLRGALIEYGSGLIGPIPNVVIFQYNPESLSRSLQIPPIQIAPEEMRTRKQRADRDELLSGGAAERENGQVVVAGNGTAKHGMLGPVATEERPIVALQWAIY